MAEDNTTNLTKGFFYGRKLKTFGDLTTKDGEELITEIRNAMARHQKILATGNTKIIKRSKEEMELIRRMVRAGSANVGSMRDNILTSLNNSVIQTETALSKISDLQESTVKKVSTSIKDSLPSADSIMGAVSIANPLLGFGMNVFKGFVDRSKQAKLEAQTHAEKLERIIETGVDSDEELVEDNKELLERVGNKEIISKLDRVHDSIEEQTSFLKDAWGDGNESLQKISELEQDQENREKQNELQSLEDTKEGALIAEDPDAPIVNVEESGGIMDTIIGLYLLRPLRGLFSGIGKTIGAIAGGLGKGLLGALRIVAGPIGLFLGAAYLFADGWSNAAELLNKKEGELTPHDKVAAGLGSIVGFIGDIVDWVTGLLGIETDLGGFLEENVTQGLAGLFDTMRAHTTDMFEFILDGIPNMFNDALHWIGSLYGKIGSFFTETAPDFIEEKFDNMLDSFFSLFDGTKAIFSDMTGFAADVGKRIKAGLRSVIEPYLPDKDGPLGFIYDVFDFWDGDDSSNADITAVNPTQTKLQALNNINNEIERLKTNQMLQNNVVMAPSTSINNQSTMYQTPLSSKNGNNVINDLNRRSMNFVTN